MGGADERHFQRVEWDDIDDSAQRLTGERLVALLGTLSVLALFVYDRRVAHVYTVGSWRADPIDWVFLLALVGAVAYGVVPAVRHRANVGRLVGRLRAEPGALFGLGFLAAFVVVGLVGPALVSSPGMRFEYAFNPPVGVSSSVTPMDCLGSVTGEVFDTECHGSWEAPLGTNERGHPLTYLLVTGARVALIVVAVTAVFVVPVAAAVGVVAGLRGGLIDDLLMSYADLQLSIPAVLIYFVGYAYWNTSLLLLLAAFGLLSWGGIARLVRSEVLQRREDGHVRVARSLGASRRYIARHHILPNITNTLVPAVFQLLAILVLVEAGIAFLGFHDIQLYSWGSTISESVNAQVPPEIQSRADQPAYRIWWVSTVPALALTLTMLSLKLVGDGLRDALDPREGRI